jgi:hypothetical protein
VWDGCTDGRIASRFDRLSERQSIQKSLVLLSTSSCRTNVAIGLVCKAARPLELHSRQGASRSARQGIYKVGFIDNHEYEEMNAVRRMSKTRGQGTRTWSQIVGAEAALVRTHPSTSKEQRRFSHAGEVREEGNERQRDGVVTSLPCAFRAVAVCPVLLPPNPRPAAKI